jgi:hypothetical protein
MVKMKRTVILLMALAMVVVPLRNSFAGDREWATAGKVMAGLAAFAILSDVVSDHHHVVRAPAPYPRRVIVVRAPRRVWVEGRYVEVVREEWVPGRFVREWVPPVRERIWVATPHGGYWREVIVRPGHDTRVWRPGHKVLRRERQWVPGHWEGI